MAAEKGAWTQRTNLRALQTTTRLVVEICHQMEGWRRLLRQIERLEAEPDATRRDLPEQRRDRNAA